MDIDKGDREPPGSEAAPGAIEGAAIADEPWLANLRADRRAEVLESRLEREVRFEYLVGQACKGWQRPVKEAVILFVIVSLLINPFSFTALLSAAVGGVVTGLLWHRLEAEQLLSVVTSMPMFLLSLMFGAGGGPGGFMIAAIASIFIGSVSGWLGLQRSLQGYH